MISPYALAGAFLCALIAWVQAVAKGRSGWWFLAGLFLPVLSNLLLAVAADLDRERELHDKVDEVLEKLRRGEAGDTKRPGIESLIQ